MPSSYLSSVPSPSGSSAGRPLGGCHAVPPPRFYLFEDDVVEVALHEPAGRVPESFVQDLWGSLRFRRDALRTTDGERLEILDPGTPNPDAGPDFVRAHVVIDGQAWRGDVEIHTVPGRWLDHGHQHDPRYDGVILHVCLDPDVWSGRIRRPDGSVVPELVLAPYLVAPVRALLHRFHTTPRGELPCAGRWAEVPADVVDAWLDRLGRERRAARRPRAGDRPLSLAEVEGQLYERLFAALGYAKNAEPMRMLARRLPLELARTIADPLDLEALFLGTAGLIPEPDALREADPGTARYALALRDRYQDLRREFSTVEMPRSLWRFFRLRPANFPPLRIAQGVALLRTLLVGDPIQALAAAVQAPGARPAVRRLLRAVPGPFWETHVRLDRVARPRTAGIGQNRADILLTEAVLPLLHLWAEQQADEALAAALERLLHVLPPARDEVTRRFAQLGTPARSAAQTQGMHQLYRTRCQAGRCLSCAIGQFLLNRGGPPSRGPNTA